MLSMNQLFRILALAAFLAAALIWLTPAWGHGGETTIVPAALNVRAGSELSVTVGGLVGSSTAVFKLTGLAGEYDLGEYPITKDDFTQVLQIPTDVPPGAYRLSVEGDSRGAKVVININ